MYGQEQVCAAPDPYSELLKGDELENTVGTSCIFCKPAKQFVLIIMSVTSVGRHVTWGIKNKVSFNKWK